METETKPNPANEKFQEISEALEQRNRNRAARLLADCAKAMPEAPQDRIGLATVAARIGESAIARYFATHAAQGEPGSAILLRAGGLLADSGDFAGATKLALRTTEMAKDFAPGWHLNGALQAQMGQIDEAKESLKRAIFIQPRMGAAWLELARIHTFTKDDPLVAQMIQARSPMSSTAPDNQAHFGFAFAKMLRDLGDLQNFWNAVEQSNRLMKTAQPYEKDADTKSAEQVLDLIAKNGSSQLKPAGEPFDRGIFVVGMPYSGCDLVEQILVSHPQVAGGGELNFFGRAATALEDMSVEKITELQTKWENPWRDVGVAYQHMLKSRFGADGRVVDRTIAQTRLTPLIHHVCSGSPIIWMRRNANDVAFECYANHFNGVARWSYDQSDLAHHMALEDKMFSAIAPTLGDKLLVVEYEKLVSAPQAEIARILSHCGLPDDPAPYAPEKKIHPIQTASILSVRKPIDASDVNCSQPFTAAMTTFQTAYAGA